MSNNCFACAIIIFTYILTPGPRILWHSRGPSYQQEQGHCSHYTAHHDRGLLKTERGGAVVLERLAAVTGENFSVK